MTDPAQRRTTRGRPEATSQGEIEQAAFELFSERGFERTTLNAIAERVGVGRRTLFRYYQSKNDIPWGQFDRTLASFREVLDGEPEDVPLHRAVHDAVVEFNRFPIDARPAHRERMALILGTPELQAHSVLRHGEWRRVIADYVARRTDQDPIDLVPRMVGQVSLALALTAYEVWLDDSSADLLAVLNDSMAELARYLGAAD